MSYVGYSAPYHIEDEVMLMTAARSKQQDHHDDTDVESALKRETQDGPGFENEEELPESDFDSFAEEGVEMSEEDPK